MAAPKKLRMGVDSPPPTPDEEASRIATLQAAVEHDLPKLAEGIASAVAQSGPHGPVFFLHQDSFAARYDDDEYMLLGMAMKYAGLRGVELSIIGKNHETF